MYGSSQGMCTEQQACSCASCLSKPLVDLMVRVSVRDMPTVTELVEPVLVLEPA